MRKRVIPNFFCVLLVCLAVVSLAGCRSKQRLALEGQVEAEREARFAQYEEEHIAGQDAARKETEKVQETAAEATMETVTKVTEFDTSKSADPVTGYPPVVRVTETVCREQRREQEREAELQVEAQQRYVRVDGLKDLQQEQTGREQARIEAEQERKVRPAGNGWWWGVIAGGIVVCIVCKINPLKELWKKWR